MGVRDINQPAVGSGWSACVASGFDPTVCGNGVDSVAEQNGRPFNAAFPYLSNIYQMANIYRSNYNGLQVTLTSRNYHGLNMVAGYTYSHGLDDVGANWDFGAGLGLPQDATHPGREYGSSDFDIRHRFTLAFTYNVPGKKSFAHLLEGSQVISIVSLYSSQPWGPIDTGATSAALARVLTAGTSSGHPSDFKSNPAAVLTCPFFPNTSLRAHTGYLHNAASSPGQMAS
jgi:hypothetical protein